VTIKIIATDSLIKKEQSVNLWLKILRQMPGMITGIFIF